MKRYCPNCLGELTSESIGWKCSECKGFIDMTGNFIEHKERPFMPPKTNFDKITESVESLAEYISSLARKCTFRDCSKEECAKFECKHCIKEWLQKEIEE